MPAPAVIELERAQQTEEPRDSWDSAAGVRDAGDCGGLLVLLSCVTLLVQYCLFALN